MNATELADAVANLIRYPEAARRAGDQGREIVAGNRGSLGKLLSLLEPLIGES
jgi:hypothetical protein